MSPQPTASDFIALAVFLAATLFLLCWIVRGFIKDIRYHRNRAALKKQSYQRNPSHGFGSGPTEEEKARFKKMRESRQEGEGW